MHQVKVSQVVGSKLQFKPILGLAGASHETRIVDEDVEAIVLGQERIHKRLDRLERSKIHGLEEHTPDFVGSGFSLFLLRQARTTVAPCFAS